MSDTTGTNSSQRVECPAASDPIVRTFIMAAILLGFGIWCLTDMRQPPAAWDMEHINDAASYVMNNFFPFGLLPAGIIYAIIGIVRFRRVLVADESGVGFSGKPVAWGDITAVDATQLASKSVLRLQHAGGELVLEAYRLKNFKELVAFVEKHVASDKIKH